MAQKFVGIDLGTHTVKVVVASAGIRGSTVLGVHEAPVPRDADSDALGASLATVAGLLREKGLRHLPTAVSLPSGEGSFRVVDFPFGDAKRIAQAVAFEVEGQFPVPLEELTYDHVVVPRTDKGGRALVVAATNEVIARLRGGMREAGADLRLVTVGPMGLAQALAGTVPASDDCPPELTPTTLVLDIGHRTSSLLALTDKGPAAARTLRRGGRSLNRALKKHYGMDDVAVEVSKHRDAFLAHAGLELTDEQRASAEVIADAMQPLLRELEHTRQWLRAEYGLFVTSVQLAGGSAALKGLDMWLRERLDVPVTLASPPGSAHLKNAGNYEWTRHCAALGAAMGAARRPLVQLAELGGGERGGSWVQERFTTLAVIGFSVCIFAGLDMIVKLDALETERDAHLASLDTAAQRVFGEEVTGLADVEERLEAARGADLTSQIPERGALEVLRALGEAAKPAADTGVAPDGTAAPVGPGAMPAVGGVGGDPGIVQTGVDENGNPTMMDPSGNPIDPATGGPAGGGAAPDPGPVDPSSGIRLDDALRFSKVEIRPLKMELAATATRSTAQDRFAMKLRELGCVGAITTGRIRDKNELKEFDMSVDHGCFTADDLGGEG